MKGLRILLLAFLVAPAGVAAVERGEPAPPFELPGLQGTIRLAEARGQVVLVDFWASWCVPCRLSFPWMNEMLARYGANGLRIVAINVDRKGPDAAKFLERVPARFDIAFDPAGLTPRAYGVKSMPSSYLVGADGKVIAVHRGFTDEDRPGLERSLRAALQLK